MPTLFNNSDIGLTAEQAANANLDYGLDWSSWLESMPAGDAIVDSVWSEPTDTLSLTNAAIDGSVTSVWVSGGVPDEWYTIENTVTTRDGRSDTRVCLMHIKPSVTTGSALFKNRLVAIAKMRRDRLMMLAGTLMPDVQVSDDYIWEKLLAAEAEVSHTLRVPLQATRYFPSQPTQDQIDALNGMAWQVESSPDYYPDMFTGDHWGMIVARHIPVISVESMKFVYPTEQNGHYDIPLDWLQIDNKYGQIRIVPTRNAVLTGLAGMSMLGMQAGRVIPSMIRMTYTAGIANAQRDYPELVDCVLKLASVKMVADLFLPQSGSISGDGLSESLSVDMSKYYDTIDHILNGPEGTNGGLMSKIHGVRMVLM